jgi:hypothetical protein
MTPAGSSIAPLIARAGGVSIPAPVRAVLRPMARRYAADVAAYRLSCMDHPAGNAWTVRVGRREHRFFFVGGSYKSGTNWVTNLLNLHPKINVTGEFHFEELFQGLDRFTSRSWYMASKEPLRTVATESIERLVRRSIYAATRDRPGALWLGDHTPRQMREALPGAPRFVVVRDGRDVLVSFAFHLLRARHPDELVPENRALAQEFVPQFRADPERFKRPSEGFLGNDAWVRKQARAWAEFLKHDTAEAERLAKANGTRVMWVRYEDLHADLEGRRAEMYRFLGLDAKDAAAPSAETKTLPGFKQENLKSFFRKGAAGDWKNYFDERLTRIFKEEAGDALIAHGYEKDRAW